MQRYQDLEIYTGLLIDEYYGTQIFELPPHLYAIANEAYYTMKEETTDQCILISGESGAGKTEAAKQMLQFLAACSTDTGRSKKIRDRLLQSNPILEAFGNAKTTRNDNSSRFGKYMEVQFDFKGEPVGGRILNYLLEKSRVMHQLTGERNYHIFYMAIAGGDAGWKDTSGITKPADDFKYLNQGGVCHVDELNDASEWSNMFDAMEGVGISSDERISLLNVVAFIMHLGQITFEGASQAKVANPEQLKQMCALLGIDEVVLEAALVKNTIIANNEAVTTDLDPTQATYARDALVRVLIGPGALWLCGGRPLFTGPCAADYQWKRVL